MTTPNVPPVPPTDEELEARLQASWGRAVSRAEDDLARSDLVASAVVSALRRDARRVAVRLTLGVAAVVMLGLAIVLGAGGRRDPVEPPASPGAPGSPVPTPYESGSPAPAGSPTPVTSPVAGEGIPFIDPLVPFPATVDGRPVVTVGPDADAALAAATDDSPIYINGWILGPDRHGCADDIGSPAPNGVLWKDCTAMPLRATVDGGATLLVYAGYGDRMSRPYAPPSTMAMELLLRVHTHDAGCAATDCAHKAVYEAVIQYRTPRIAPPLLAATMPPGGISMAEATAAADAYVAKDPLGYGGPWVLLRAEVGSRLLVRNSGSEGDWMWAVWYVSKDGYYEITVYVGYLDGQARESTGGNLRFP